MTTDQIVALVAGIPTILTAVTGLIVAIKSNNNANAAHARINDMVGIKAQTRKVKVIPVSEPTEPVTPELPKVGQAGASLMGFSAQPGASGPETPAVAPADLGTAETDALSDVAQDVAPVETAVSEDVPLVKRLIAQVRQLIDDFESKHS